LTEEWTEKWKETQKILMEEKVLALRKAGTGVVLDSNRPHLIGIDDDVLSTGITLYHLKVRKKDSSFITFLCFSKTTVNTENSYKSDFIL